ncbi:hypothetical protein GQ53DRAFT_876471 [Thozetella sp. PMI_491]|nr:hypothetical protein GQ53DRAFT_876471 [Thozetella sp. PMI_491]
MSYGYPGRGYGPPSYPPGPPGPPGPPPHHFGGYQHPPYPPQGYHHGAAPGGQRGFGAGHRQIPPPPPGQHFAPHGLPPGPRPQNLDIYGHPTRSYSGLENHQYMSRDVSQPPPPPQGAQSFGQNAPGGYKFQYSNCTGRRKALLIGINYFGQQGELRGCINDVKNVSTFLIERYNYKREDIVYLTDDQEDPILHPTRDNIIRAMKWLVAGAQPNDSLFLHYSGHGGQTEDLDGDEDDGYDEVIYPVDYKQTSHIVDDEIHDLVVKPLQAGVRLTAIFDSCHSGTVMDLPYIYSTKGVLKEPNLAKEAGEGLLTAISSYSSGDLEGVARSIMSFAKTAMFSEEAHKKTIATKTSPADVIMWSGSKDDQTSADATIAAQATGAMSWAFIAALKQNPQQSYVQLLNSIRDVLATKYTQKPQLSCSHPLDTNLLFVM